MVPVTSQYPARVSGPSHSVSGPKTCDQGFISFSLDGNCNLLVYP